MKSALLILCSLFTAGASLAQGCAAPIPGAGTTSGVAIINFVVYNNAPSALDGAIHVWNEGCYNAGTAFPSLNATSSPLSGVGIMNVTVSFQSGTSSTNSCGESFMRYDAHGTLQSGSIIIFEYEVVNGTHVQCNTLNNYAAVIAHEMGHALGLYDEYLIDPNACVGAIMSRDPEYVFSDECQVADANYQTYSEMPPPPPPPNPNGHTSDGCGDDCSPLVLAFDDTSYKFSSAADGVQFDIDADGIADQVAWPVDPNSVAFLFLDRDGSALPNNGGELFGNVTRLRNGQRASNGFEALAELDADGDGVITSSDPEWSHLSLWFDRNRDGRADRSEVMSLDDAGVTALEVTPTWTGRHDRFGNLMKWKARFARRTGWRPYYDVYLKIDR